MFSQKAVPNPGCRRTMNTQAGRSGGGYVVADVLFVGEAAEPFMDNTESPAGSLSTTDHCEERH